MITDYNKSKYPIDILDEMIIRYAYSPKTRRWPLKLFMWIVDAAAHNAYILSKFSKPRRTFLAELSEEVN